MTISIIDGGCFSDEPVAGSGGYTLGDEWTSSDGSGTTVGEWIGIPSGWSELLVAYNGVSSTFNFNVRLLLGSASGYTTTVVGRSYLHNTSTANTWGSSIMELHTTQADTTAQTGFVNILAVDPSGAAATRTYVVNGKHFRDAGSLWLVAGRVTAVTAEIDRIKMTVNTGNSDGTPLVSIWYR